MQLSAILTATFSTLALASPATFGMAKRDTRNVFITTGLNWTGANQNVAVENNVVYNWNDKVRWNGGRFGPRSLGPDSGVCCILYDENGVPSGTICNPGTGNVGDWWIEHTQQFKCWW